jgi:peptidoglycan/xylan/chitin deacetylase (PgdA/CDA1 family)
MYDTLNWQNKMSLKNEKRLKDDFRNLKSKRWYYKSIAKNNFDLIAISTVFSFLTFVNTSNGKNIFEKFLLCVTLFLILMVPINAMGQVNANVEFLIKNTNGDRIDSQNVKLLIYNERNQEIEALLGNKSLETNLPTNHRYQIDVYVMDYLVNTEYTYVDKSSIVDLTVPISHGVIVSVSHSDGKSIENAEVTLLTNKNTKVSSQKTDLEGNTLRMWVPPTSQDGGYYEIMVKFGNMTHTEGNINFQPGRQSLFSIVTPWPSSIESLFEIELLDNNDKKIDANNFEINLINKNSEIKYNPTSIIRGIVFISQIPLGEYNIQMIEKDSKEFVESESFQITEIEKISVRFPSFSFSSSDIHEDVKKFGITCNCVAFRLDDVQNHWLNDVQIEVMEVFRETQNPLTIGVITKGIKEDEKIKNYINSRLGKTPELEIANHSWDNIRYTDLGLNEQEIILKKSHNTIKEIFSITPKVFIPPQNAFDKNTINVLKSNKYTHYSSEFDFSVSPFPLKGETIYNFPAGAATGNLDKELSLFMGVGNKEIFRDIKESLTEHGFAVVTMHPQEFSIIRDGTYMNEVNEEQLEELKKLIEMIRAEGLRVVPLGKINLGPSIVKEEIPDWLKNNARWWGKNQISDKEFVHGIQFLIKNNIISVPKSDESSSTEIIPSWIRNNARWWANDQISNEEFVRGIQFMVNNNIIQII